MKVKKNLLLSIWLFFVLVNVGFSESKVLVGPVFFASSIKGIVVGEVESTKIVLNVGTSLIFQGVSSSSNWVTSLGLSTDNDITLFQGDVSVRIIERFCLGASINYPVWNKKFDYTVKGNVGFGLFISCLTYLGNIKFGYSIVTGYTCKNIVFWNPYHLYWQKGVIKKYLMIDTIYMSISFYLH